MTVDVKSSCCTRDVERSTEGSRGHGRLSKVREEPVNKASRYWIKVRVDTLFKTNSLPNDIHHCNGVVWCSPGGNGYLALSMKVRENQIATKPDLSENTANDHCCGGVACSLLQANRRLY
ncbi:hypothetical protein AVEN_79346-1 [Araneus ventricosus]|uniref:Uncharacterized protein n=1 Tax=Araneus ventricosus TaxID=182803 RepID=A0A4Y2IZC4_ARAVE|nr:hypothetical protein AVEN_79346-1 [Araneus ventricosus]